MNGSAPQGTALFIVGVLRSGTTLLRVVLDRHPLLAIPPESHFIPDLWSKRRRYGRRGRIEHPDRFLQDLATHPRFLRWELPLEAVQSKLAVLDSPTFGDGIGAIFDAYASREGKPRWGDKTPRYVNHIPLLAHIFPDAQFIHVIRDGRNVALSIVDVGRFHRRSATAAIAWARGVTNGRNAGAELGSERYFECRYERLVDDLEGELRRLSAFAKLPFDSGMLEHDQHAIERVPIRQRHMHGRLAMPPTRGLRNWQTQMQAIELAEFEAIAGPALLAADYDLAAGRVAATTRLRAWSRMLGFAFRVMKRRIRVLFRGRAQMRAERHL